MIAEEPYIVLTHHHDGRVLAVVVDGAHYTPVEIKAALTKLEEVASEDELAADRAALARFQERLAADLRAAEERGRVQTRIEWRGYLRKAIRRERALRAERDELRGIIDDACWILEETIKRGGDSPALFHNATRAYELLRDRAAPGQAERARLAAREEGEDGR